MREKGNENDSTLQLLDERQTARLIRVSRGCLRHWRAVGQGPPWLRIGERLVRYNVAALREWVEKEAEVRQ